MLLLKRSCIIALVLTIIAMHKISAQAEFTTWGNMTGIRVDGQLMEFETSACVVSKDRSYVNKTEREKQPIFFSREKEKNIFE
jgi:hypothetical protein